VVGGVLGSPLTGIVFTLELTHAWPALLPLIIAAVTAYAISVLLLDRSVLTEKIARRGLHVTRDYTTDPLETFFVADVMRPEASNIPVGGTVSTRDTLRHAANVLAEAGGRPLRVVSPDGTEEGHVEWQDLLAARMHDLTEDTERTRHLIGFGRRPASPPDPSVS
jgi:chloride channel protein, CIC family